MPQLDVSEALLDPDFCEKIHVVRRDQTVGTDGLAVEGATHLYPYGVVTAGNIREYDIEPDMERAKDSITVHVSVPLRGPSVGSTQRAPDIIVYQDNNYVVRKAYNWSRYGRGFYAAECDMTDLEVARDPC